MVQYTACHKRYPFQEKFPASIIWHSSIDEATITQDLYQACTDPGIFVRPGGGGGGGGGGAAGGGGGGGGRGGSRSNCQ